MKAQIPIEPRPSTSKYLLSRILIVVGLSLTLALFGKAPRAHAQPGVIYTHIDGRNAYRNSRGYAVAEDIEPVTSPQSDDEKLTKANSYNTTISETTSTENSILCITDLVVSKSDSQTTITPGDVLAYLITITNTGRYEAYNIVLTDTLPANTTFVAASNYGNETVSGSGEITWPTFNLWGGRSTTRLLVATLNNPLPAGVSAITNTVRVDNTIDINPDNNVAYDIDTVIAAPDLTIAKDDGGIALTPGSPLNYVITYANAGNQTATGVIITETVPAHTTFDATNSSPVWSCDHEAPGGTICTFTIGTLSVGNPETVDFAVTILTPLPAGVTQIDNTIEIADDGTNGADLNPADNTDADFTPIIANIDLVIAKTDGGITAPAGETVVYTLTYANLGNQVATGVIVTDTVPLYTTFNAAASSPGWSCPDGAPAGMECALALGTVGANAGALYFAVNFPPTLPPGVPGIENTAVIADDGTNGDDRNPCNNTGSDTTPAGTAPDLTIAKDDGGIALTPGSLLNYVITYANVGTQTATSVVITETVPAHTTFDATNSDPGWSCAHEAPGGTICTFAVGTLSVGSLKTIDFGVIILTPLPAGVTQIDNTIEIADDGTNGEDQNPADNTDADFTPIIANIDLTIAKTDGGINAPAGGTVVYTLTYTNLGNQIASSGVVTDTVPLYTTFNAAASSPGWSCPDSAPAGTTCTYALGTVGNETGELYFAVNLPPALPPGVPGIENTATIADDGTNGDDHNPCNNTDSDTTPVGATSDLAVILDNGQSAVQLNQQLTYVIAVTNQGTQPATNVLITDTLPAELVFTSASDAGIETYAGSGVITWPPIDELASGDIVTRVLHATVVGTIPTGVTHITNIAEVADDGSHGPDANPENNTAMDTDVIDAAPDVAITKTTDTLSAYTGDLVVYTMTVSNIGTQGATGVVITDQLPSYTSFYTASDGGFEVITDTVSWPPMVLEAGDYTTRTLTLRIGASVNGGAITNTALVADDGNNGTDLVLQNNQDTATIVIKLHKLYLPLVLRRYVLAPDLVVDAIVVGNGTITITISNQGQRAVLPGQDFWVDLYVNPDPPPAAVNQTWNSLSSYGAAWLVFGGALPINPGASRTLSLYDPYYWEIYSALPTTLNPGDVLYAQVDSANTTTTYGVVLEEHEIIGTPYNNVSHIVVTEQQPINPATSVITDNDVQQVVPFPIPIRPK